MMVPDSIYIQWRRLKIVDAVNGNVLSDYYKVYQLFQNVQIGDTLHDIIILLCGRPQIHKPYSAELNVPIPPDPYIDVVVELVVGVDHKKCNAVIIEKGDNPVEVYFDGKLLAVTEQVNQNQIWFNDVPPKLFKKWLSFNFWKREHDP